MISFVCWKWTAKNGNRLFLSKHVNILRAMVARWYQEPFRFICITDEPAGLHKKIEAIPLPVRFDTVPNLYGAHFPVCYCRLWNFSHEAAALGERILQVDIDVVITGDISPLVNRGEDFVGWCDVRFGWNKIAGGVYLLRTGSLPHIWEDFNPEISPRNAFDAGNLGSDQGWMSYKLYPPPGQWGKNDGLTKINWTMTGAPRPPRGAKMVFTTGLKPPWDADVQRRYPWVKKHWRA